jgi:hypothetical protein
MNYEKIYNNIIERSKDRILEGYVEKHHIIPKCMGGANIPNNISVLTAREHFLCHKLLCEIYSDNTKLRNSLFLMSIGKRKKIKNQYKISSREYERIKLEYSLFLIGKKHSEETNLKKSNKMKKIWFEKTKEEKSIIGHKRWDTRIKNGTNIVTKDQAENISKALKERKTPWLTKKVSQYSLEGTWIRDWESQASILKHPDYGNVQGCLQNKQKTAYGFIWKFKENKL